MHQGVERVRLAQRRPSELPRWSVWLAGERVGEIAEVHMPGCRTLFYKALVLIPGLPHSPVNLEMHPDLDRQVHELVEFHHDPSAYARHLTREQAQFLFGQQESLAPHGEPGIS
jgi:hypothetical protein